MPDKRAHSQSVGKAVFSIFRSLALAGLVAGSAALLLVAHYAFIPWYAKERSPYGKPELVDRFVNDPGVAVVCFYGIAVLTPKAIDCLRLSIKAVTACLPSTGHS